MAICGESSWHGFTLGWWHAFRRSTTTGTKMGSNMVACETLQRQPTLIDKGYKNITINDISALSIEISQSHNIHNLKKISFLTGDITNLKLPKNYFNLWHDRAVFHFLTEKEKREKYINQIRKSLLIHGYIIISVFSLDGPKKCSSLTIKQYDETTLSSELGECFKLINFSYSNHFTPSNKKQNFITCCFKLIKK